MAVEVLKLPSEEVTQEVEWLRDVLSSCFGPWGNTVVLYPHQGGPEGPGGVATLTRHTPKLLQLMRSSNPLTKAIISHLQAHAHNYRDSTLYAGILACK